ncbi:MAG: hypothetical protein HY978_00700 [Candidatus Liptonbacteria bacterium]|nr:hypothetical protein [Candidatus Liptonbacteria bacterium]
MLWLLLAIAAHFLFALVALGDKYLLSKSLPEPLTYAFFVGLLGALLFLATPFLGLPLPAAHALVLAVAGGTAFTLGNWRYFCGLKLFEASRIVPATGGLVPLITLLLGLAFLPHAAPLTLTHWIALALLIIGTITISLDPSKKISGRSFGMAALAALLFASSFSLMKLAYLEQPFWSGLFWSQVGMTGTALIFLLLSPALRRDLLGSRQEFSTRLKPQTLALFLGIQAGGASGSLLQSAAIFFAPALYVAFVNAMQGFQYMILLLLTVILSRRHSQIIQETSSPGTFIQKSVAILMILLGTGLLLL